MAIKNYAFLKRPYFQQYIISIGNTKSIFKYNTKADVTKYLSEFGF